jgi:hypothetical protein
MPTNTLGPQSSDLRDIVNSAIPVVASAAIISPISDMIRITGNTTINTIVPPDPWFVGPLNMFNTDAAVGTISTTGNVAIGVTLTRFRVFSLFFDKGTQLWYPSNTV